MTVFRIQQDSDDLTVTTFGRGNLCVQNFEIIMALDGNRYWAQHIYGDVKEPEIFSA